MLRNLSAHSSSFLLLAALSSLLRQASFLRWPSAQSLWSWSSPAGTFPAGISIRPSHSLFSSVGDWKLKDVVPYWLAQMLAGIAAAFVAMFLIGKSGTPMEITNIPAAFVAEFLFTFALAYVVAEFRDRERYGWTTVFTAWPSVSRSWPAHIRGRHRFLAARSIRRSRSVRR